MQTSETTATPTTITAEDVIAAFTMMDAAGIRRPDNLLPPPRGRDESTESWHGRCRAAARRVAEVYARALCDLSREQLEDATITVIRSSSPFWPTPGQLLAAVPERRAAAVDDSDAAWGEALRIVQGWGAHRLYDPDTWEKARPADAAKAEALLAGVQAIGGWKELGRSTAEEHIAMRASFRSAYRAVGQRRSIQAEADVARRIAGGDRVAALLEEQPRGGFARIGAAVPLPMPRPPSPPPRPPVPPPARAAAERVAPPSQQEIEARRARVAELARARGIVTRGEG